MFVGFRWNYHCNQQMTDCNRGYRGLVGVVYFESLMFSITLSQFASMWLLLSVILSVDVIVLRPINQLSLFHWVVLSTNSTYLKMEQKVELEQEQE